MLAELAAGDGGVSTDSTIALAAELSPLLPSPSEPSPDLLGPNTRSVGLLWHADQLIALSRSEFTESASEAARRRYHARMLGYGLAPEQPGFRPLVTILLPVYNRAGPLLEAIQSCVDQTWRPIEILVIDDGSTDDVQSILRQFAGQIRLIRKANGGAASARNLGLRMAQGDFVHFLDSDDLLTPRAIENAIAAFASVADADLCYGQRQWTDMRSTPPRVKDLKIRDLQNPIRSMIVEFAFTVPTVMMPRWRMLAMPPFEEDLRRSSDWRYWQNLGFARVKAIGMRTLSAHLRRFQHSLQSTPHAEDDSHAVAVLRGLRDLVRHSHAWPYAVEYMNLLMSDNVRHWFAAAPSERIGSALSELAAALEPGPGASGPVDLSMLPILAAMRGRIKKLKQDDHWADENPDCAYRLIASGISRAVAGTSPISDRDIAFWTRTPEAPRHDDRLQRFFASIRRCCQTAQAAALADSLLRRCQKIPGRKAVRLAARLRPFTGARLAGAMTARWTTRHTG